MLNNESESEAVLKKIAPSRLVGDKKDSMEDFFLVLAVIYNDLKGLIHLEKDFMDNHAPPTSGTPSAYLGEYNGMTTQLYKTMAGLVNEFFVFLREHEQLYKEPRFQLMFLKMDPSVRKEWEGILDAALERPNSKKPGTLGYRLMRVRDGVAFHYYQSEKVLRGAFKDFFHDNTQTNADFAYYSFGENMQDTRFYYADAAVQSYLMKTANEKGTQNYTTDMAILQAFQSETFSLIRSMNIVLANLLKRFITMRHETRG